MPTYNAITNAFRELSPLDQEQVLIQLIGMRFGVLGQSEMPIQDADDLTVAIIMSSERRSWLVERGQECWDDQEASCAAGFGSPGVDLHEMIGILETVENPGDFATKCDQLIARIPHSDA